MNSDDLETLGDYADLDGTEIGDYINALLCLRQFEPSHGMSEGFSSAIDKELRLWLQRFQTETYITTINVPQPDRIVRELVWE